MNLNYKKLVKDQVLEQVKNQVANNGAWFEILNAAGDDDEPAKIRIYGIIGESFWFKSISAADFVEELDQITASEIHVLINSVGGSAWDGIAIYNALRAHPARVTTRVEGVALSAASVIVQAGDDRVMMGATQMMIHNAWFFTAGNAEELRSDAAILDKQDQLIAGIYADRTGKPKSHFLKLMGEETWLTDEETIDEGLADEVDNPAPKATKATGASTSSEVEDLIRLAIVGNQPEPRITFKEQAQSVLTDVDQLIDRAEKVIAFRAEQGKPPLSEDSVELFEQLQATHKRLADVITSQTDTPHPTDTAELDDIYVRLVEDSLKEEMV